MQNLLMLCSSAECNREKAYVGTIIGGSPVMMDAKHKWHNQAYIMHANVKNYLPYALGGGYIISGDIVKARLLMQRMLCSMQCMLCSMQCSQSAVLPVCSASSLQCFLLAAARNARSAPSVAAQPVTLHTPAL
jgi:hypothetical protein